MDKIIKRPKPLPFRKERYTVEEVLSKICSGKVDFDGDLIKMDSQRYRLFKRDGCVCVKCGLEGTYFVKEKHVKTDPYHFNLYGIRDGEEVCITKDHFLPKSKGGKDVMENYKVFCWDCNHVKGNTLETE